MYTTLIDAATLHAHLDAADWRVVDCRFDLADVGAGRRAYLDGHVPGACYAHLDEDLSGPPLTDHGRHPMPAPEVLEATFARLGIGNRTQVVAYDLMDAGIAARLWWLLRYMGHAAVAVLDGGWQAWTGAGLPIEAGEVCPEPAVFRGRARREWLVTVESVPGAARLVDAREPARYRGEVEPLDPVAGHIPGAVNHHYLGNLGAQGRFLEPALVRERLLASLGGVPSQEAVFYCGSGVSACQNLLALAHAGLAPGRLYGGSWSDWCRDPRRPVATGAAPGPA